MNVPAPLRNSLSEHQVATAYDCGWSALSNGELIRAAEGAGYEVLITTDKGIHYQHNWSGRKLALVVLSTNSWPRLKLATDQVLDAVRHIKPAMIVSVVVPNRLS